jgi:hypothetical protein
MLRSGGSVSPGRVAHSGSVTGPEAGWACSRGAGGGAGAGGDAGLGAGGGGGGTKPTGDLSGASTTSWVQPEPSHRRRRASSAGSGYHPAGANDESSLTSHSSFRCPDTLPGSAPRVIRVYVSGYALAMRPARRSRCELRRPFMHLSSMGRCVPIRKAEFKLRDSCHQLQPPREPRGRRDS